jgi:hypothetical protein
VKAICQNIRQGRQIPYLRCTDGEAKCIGSNSILTSRGWFVGRPEREAGVHDHKNISVKNNDKRSKGTENQKFTNK